MSELKKMGLKFWPLTHDEEIAEVKKEDLKLLPIGSWPPDLFKVYIEADIKLTAHYWTPYLCRRWGCPACWLNQEAKLEQLEPQRWLDDGGPDIPDTMTRIWRD